MDQSEVFAMGFLLDRVLVALPGIAVIVASMVALIVAATACGYSICPSTTSFYVSSPIIEVSPNPGSEGRAVTVSGMNFTPNGTASLYGLPNAVYTSNTDKNGNVSWSFTDEVWLASYQIYALDGNYTNQKSNTVTLRVNPVYSSPMPPLNDFPPDFTPPPSPSPTPQPSPALPMYKAFAVLIATAAVLMAVKEPKKK